MSRMRSIVGICAVFLVVGTAAQAQTSLFDQPLSPATPPGAVPATAAPATIAPAPPAQVPTAASPATARPAAARPATPRPVAAAPAAAAPAAVTEPSSAPMAAVQKPKAKPRGKSPARMLSVSNETTNTITDIEVTSGSETIKLGKALAPGEKAQLKLPALKSCASTVSATFANAEAADTSDYDLCKDKTLRFTD